MHALRRLAAAIDDLNRCVGRCTAWLVGAAVLIAAAQAILRRVFGLASNAWSDAQWTLSGAAFLLAVGYVLLVDEHVRVDALARRITPRWRAALDLVVLLGVALPLAALMVGLGFAYAWRAFAAAEHSFMADGLLLWPVRLAVPIGFGLLGLQAVSEAIKRFEFLRGARPAATTAEADLPPFLGPRPGGGTRAPH